ncbi:MAG TPA: glycosyltransferase [Geminicoccaceae bacterium]|nr:glycosyltransferase [Geminicoccus sp.]HMU51154.1 glycosyltransferase [Geminicoccaceae bacterium]
MSGRRRLLFVWQHLGAYHADRLRALEAALGSRFEIVGIELASTSEKYAWGEYRGPLGFRRVTLFPGVAAERTSPWRRFRRLLGTVRELRPSAVFLCNVNEPETIALAAVCRLLRLRVFALLGAKFDDHDRGALLEAAKMPLMRLFHGGIAGGSINVAYYRFLGMPADRLHPGYETIDIERIRASAGAPPAPDGLPFADRHFTIVARLVPEKNLARAISAYARYRAMAGAGARELHLCGSGVLEPALRAQAANIEGIRFCGFLDAQAIARELASSLCLMLPSLSEPWGLVVNEAFAMGVPVLCSDNVGARHDLVRTAVNGYVVEPGNVAGLARLMLAIAGDERHWRGLAVEARDAAPLGDVAQFVRSVSRLVGAVAEDKAASRVAREAPVAAGR